ncbi:MAG TPA: trans-aconitate 2-methyltransferase [Rhizomicrobium sp.]|nr:trans-aconitate 2-methyltransferase [Rhizomicrobium sp.]
MAWDPKTYMTFAAERTRPAAELLARVPLDNPKHVADLGCGPGNSTALLAARWPDADVEGVDSSAEMLAEARASGIKARWTLADVAQWAPAAPCDAVFSNATLQWVPDHPVLLPRLMAQVRGGGVFAFQVPRNFGEPCHTLIHEIAHDGPWAARLKGVRDWWNVLEPEAYFGILEPHARALDIWETRYVQVLEGEDAVYRWMSGTGLRPFANALQGGEREAFLEEYRKRVAEAYPMRASGKTLYPFQRLFAVARR